MLTQIPGRALLWAFSSIIVIYAFLAIDVTRTLVPPLFDDDRRQRMIVEFQQGQGPASEAYDPAQRVDEGGLFFAIQGDATSIEYTYGEESNYAQLIEYISLPRLNHGFLTVHTGTGGLALGLMLILLIPNLRRRTFRYHKLMGRTTASITAVSMICAVAYLITTPEESVFADKAFYIGLWILAVLVSVALALAVYAIRQGNRARHQAFMHMVFAALLTAPLLRLDWMLLGLFHPDTTWTQNHFLAEVVLLPQCLVVGYLFFLWARRMNPPAADEAPLPAPQTFTPVNAPTVVVLGIGFALLSLFYLDIEYLNYASMPLLTSVEQHPAAVRVAGAALAADQPLLFAGQRLLMVITALLALGLLAWQWLRGLPVLQLPAGPRWLVSVMLLISGLLALWVAPEMGAPSHALRSAGGYLVIYGLIAIVLFALKLWSHLSANIEIEREVYWLTFGLAMAPAQFSISWLMETTIGSPVLDAYAMGAGNAALGLILPLFWVFWSQQATRRRVY